MRQNDLRSLRVRQKRRSYARFFALLGGVLVLALVFGAYSYLSAADEPPARAAATSPVRTSAQEQTAPAATENKAAAAPISESAEKASVETEEKPAAAAPAGTSILIKKSEFRLYLLEDGNVIRSFPVALGKNAGQKRVSGDTKTPDGSFPIDEVIDSSDWTHDFGDGKGEIEGAYGPYFISLDTSELSGGAWDGIGIHGTHDPTSIGTRASEGCIRMHNSDLLALKKQITVGTRVTIEE